ncbi:MAG: hypothetical protein M5U09_19900 [Gammaproteobacteria bacterium]|nr:hypothetical protein [Gammaproteobacteria bacterium]
MLRHSKSALPSPVEVAEPREFPGRIIQGQRIRRARAICAVHEPDDIAPATRVAPEEVASAIAVEVEDDGVPFEDVQIDTAVGDPAGNGRRIRLAPDRSADAVETDGRIPALGLKIRYIS